MNYCDVYKQNSLAQTLALKHGSSFLPSEEKVNEILNITKVKAQSQNHNL